MTIILELSVLQHSDHTQYNRTSNETISDNLPSDTGFQLVIKNSSIAITDELTV